MNNTTYDNEYSPKLGDRIIARRKVHSKIYNNLIIGSVSETHENACRVKTNEGTERESDFRLHYSDWDIACADHYLKIIEIDEIGRFQLKKPLLAVIQIDYYEDSQQELYIVDWNELDQLFYSVGDTEEEAIENFKKEIEELYDELNIAPDSELSEPWIVFKEEILKRIRYE